jgi:hypothetical protein
MLYGRRADGVQATGAPAIMISTEPIGSLPSPLGLIGAVRAQRDLPLAKVAAPSLASESIEGR